MKTLKSKPLQKVAVRNQQRNIQGKKIYILQDLLYFKQKTL